MFTSVLNSLSRHFAVYRPELQYLPSSVIEAGEVQNADFSDPLFPKEILMYRIEELRMSIEVEDDDEDDDLDDA